MTESIQVIGQGAKTMPITREAEGANAVPNRIGTRLNNNESRPHFFPHFFLRSNWVIDCIL
jgi:hypothetical protein